MYNNGKTYIWIPSALTLNKLTVATSALVNAVHTALGLPSVSAGALNPYYFDLNDLDMGGAPFTRDAEPGLAVCGPIENLSYLPTQYVALITAFGGDVEGLPVFFELDSLDADVPAAFPSSGASRSWSLWGVSNGSHAPVQIGTKWYRSSAYGQSGTQLNASHWVAAMQGGLVVKTKAEYLAILAENAQP